MLFAGIDVGTSYVKVVILNESKKIISSFIKRTGAFIEDSIQKSFGTAVLNGSISKSLIQHITSTGFGRNKVNFGNSMKTEISCHAKGAYFYYPKKITIIDIGGQDTKVIKLDDDGRIIRFKMNRKCAAGTGVFIEEIANRLDLPLTEMNNLAEKSKTDVPLSSFCTVFAKTEILTRIKEGEKIEDLVKAAYESVIRRVIEMAELEAPIVLTGGVIAHNKIIAKILKRELSAEILVPPNPQLTGALGAALFAMESI